MSVFKQSVLSALFACVSLLSAPWASSQTLVGSLDGDANNDMGNLSYTLPFQLPTGANGISPVLGLQYQSGLRTGFSLQGTSAITRCAASKKIDGVTGYIGFASSDRYCLDSQRLIVTSGYDGAVGATYTPYQKNFSRVTSVGGSANNPQSWEVRTKDGWMVRMTPLKTVRAKATIAGIYPVRPTVSVTQCRITTVT